MADNSLFHWPDESSNNSYRMLQEEVVPYSESNVAVHTSKIEACTFGRPCP